MVQNVNTQKWTRSEDTKSNKHKHFEVMFKNKVCLSWLWFVGALYNLCLFLIVLAYTECPKIMWQLYVTNVCEKC